MTAKKQIYLDYAAGAPLDPKVKAQMERVSEGLASGEFANSSALYAAGQRSRELIDAARTEVALLINAQPSEIIFTSGGTESNNTVIQAFARQVIWTTPIEHPSILEPLRKFARQKSRFVPVDAEGRVSPKNFYRDPNPKYCPSLVSVMLANNEIGTIEPVREVSMKCRSPKYKTLMHTDATQAIGKIPVDVNELKVDLLSFSAHKIGGPAGIGVLYVRKNAHVRPLLSGGNQERGRRAGTENVMLIAGLAKAAKLARARLVDWGKVAEFRDELRSGILKEIPHVILNSPKEGCLPNILNVSFEAIEGEALQLMLDEVGIAVSTGSACASSKLEPSHVIMATRNNAEIAHGSVRFSLGLDTTAEDIQYVMEVLPGIVKKLRDMSTVKVGKYA